MENSMQQVEEKKSEKLVPIDTSGEAIRCRIKRRDIFNPPVKRSLPMILLLSKFKKKKQQL